MTDDMYTLFGEIDRHLMADEAPSLYLSGLTEQKTFSQQPFDMLIEMIRTPQSPKYHPEGSVWVHTLMVVDEAAHVRDFSPAPRVFMWAALLHDIGKPPTTKVKKGRVTSYDHDKVGEKLSREFLEYFDEDDEFVNSVCALVRYHMQPLFVVKDLPFADMEGMLASTDLAEVARLGLCDRMGRLHADRNEEERNIIKFMEKCLIRVKR